MRWLREIGALQFVTKDRWRLQFRKDAPPITVPPAWMTSESYQRLTSPIDQQIEVLTQERLPLDRLEAKLATILDQIIRIVENDQSLNSAILAHIRWRLRLPERALTLAGPGLGFGSTSKPYQLSLAGTHQLLCLLDWSGISYGLWQNDAWRECMRLRYDYRRTTPMVLISRSLRQQLDQIAAELRQRGACGHLDSENYGRVYSLAAEIKPYSPPRSMVATWYVESQIMPEGSRVLRWISEPVTGGEFFKRVADLERGARPPRLGPDPLGDEESFWRYLCIPAGHPTELAGRVLCHMLRLEKWNEDQYQTPLPEELQEIWPSFDITDAYEPQPEYKAYTHALCESLGLDERIFKRIFVVYIAYHMQRKWRGTWIPDGQVFWAARILEALDPDRCRAYREWIRFIQSRIRRRATAIVAGSKDGHQPDPSIIRAVLAADPLLNCVFHSDLLKGEEQISQRKNKPVSDNTMINATLAFAAQELEAVWRRRPQLSIIDVLRQLPSIPQGAEFLVDERYWTADVERGDVGPRSLYTFLIPIAIILFGSTKAEFTPQTVKWRCLEYADLPDVHAFQKGLTAHMSELIGWKLPQ